MEYLEKLEQTLKIFEEETDKISKIPILIDNVANLISEVNEEKKEITAQCSQLSTLEQNIREESKRINEYIEIEKDTKSEFLSIVKNSLLQSSQENMELYNTLSKAIANKIDATESNLNATMAKNNSNLIEEIGNLRQKVREIEEDITEKSKRIDDNLVELKVIVPQVKKLQNFSMISIILSLVVCVLIVIQLV